MPSSLFSSLGGRSRNTPTQLPPMDPNNNGFINMMGQLNSFAQQFQGNPQEQVSKLMQSGQMSQDTFNRLAPMAAFIRRLFK